MLGVRPGNHLPHSWLIFQGARARREEREGDAPFLLGAESLVVLCWGVASSFLANTEQPLVFFVRWVPQCCSLRWVLGQVLCVLRGLPSAQVFDS